MRSHAYEGLILALLFVQPAACAPKAPPSKPHASTAAVSKAPSWQQLTDVGVDAYEEGRYSEAERLLQAVKKAQSFAPKDPRRGDS